MRLLGIDYGLKKIGLALADSDLAQPLGVVKVGGGRWDVGSGKINKFVSGEINKFVSGEIRKICQKYRIEKIVIGLPEGKMARRVKKFGQGLSQLTGLLVDFQDETLTSQEAVAKMIEAGKKRKARQEKEDAVAAALILQNYLGK